MIDKDDEDSVSNNTRDVLKVRQVSGRRVSAFESEPVSDSSAERCTQPYSDQVGDIFHVIRRSVITHDYYETVL